jgi:BASS family bile acid:Na+ symporter
MLLRLLDGIGRHGTRFMALGVLLGLVAPPLAALAAPLLVPTLLIPLAIALTRIEWAAASAYRRRPLVVTVLLAWLMVASPILVAAVVFVLPLPETLRHALVLMAASSPIVSAVAISFLVGLDAALAVVLVVLATAAVAFSLPAMAWMLLGLQLEIALDLLMLRLGLMVGIAFAAAALARRIVSRDAILRHRRVLDGLSVCCLVVFAVAIMNGVTAFAAENPRYVVLATVAAFVANIALQAVSIGLFWNLGRRLALTVGLCAGNCNMGLVLVALQGEAPFELVVFFAMAQLPMYMLPMLQEPVYRRLLAEPLDSRPGRGRARG